MPLTDVLRLEVSKRLTVALQEITIANGYLTDLGGSVFRGRAVYGADDPVPMLSILEVPIPIELLPPPSASSYSSGSWELMIQGFVKDDPVNPTDPAHPLLADVKKRLAIERKKMSKRKPEEGLFGIGNHVTGLNIGPGVVRPADEISAKAYFWLTIQLELAEDLENPLGDS